MPQCALSWSTPALLGHGLAGDFFFGVKMVNCSAAGGLAPWSKETDDEWPTLNCSAWPVGRGLFTCSSIIIAGTWISQNVVTERDRGSAEDNGRGRRKGRGAVAMASSPPRRISRVHSLQQKQPGQAGQTGQFHLQLITQQQPFMSPISAPPPSPWQRSEPLIVDKTKMAIIAGSASSCCTSPTGRPTDGAAPCRCNTATAMAHQLDLWGQVPPKSAPGRHDPPLKQHNSGC